MKHSLTSIGEAGGNFSLENSLNRLVDKLAGIGIVMNVRDYVEFIAIFQQLEDQDPVNLKYYLAPLTCRSEIEQQNFYKAYDQWLNDEADIVQKEADDAQKKIESDKKTRIAKRKRRNYYIIATILVLLTVGLALWRLSRAPEIINPQWCLTGNNIVNDTITFNSDCDGRIKRAGDTSHYIWKFGDGDSLISKKTLTEHVYSKAGNYKVSLKVISNGKSYFKDTVLDICPATGSVDITPATVDSGKQVGIQFAPKDPTPEIQLKWFVINNNTGETIDSLAFAKPRFKYLPPSSGNFTVKLESNQNDKCPVAMGTFTVDAPPVPYTLQATSIGQQIKPEYSINYVLLVLAAFIIILLCLLGQYFYWHNFSSAKKIATDNQSFPKPVLGALGRGKPDVIPFQGKDQLIRQERELMKVFQELQQKTPSEFQALDIGKTITSTIYNHDLFSPTYTPRRQDLHYLFLIDGSGNYNQQINLFTFLAKIFVRENVQLSLYFFYNNIDICHNLNKSESYSIGELYSRFDQAVLLMISDGNCLFNPSFPALIPKLVDKINQWDIRILVTPVPAKDWGGHEKLLSSIFKLVPADLEGWVRIIQMINEEQSLKAIPSDWLDESTKDVNFENPESLKAYLDNDEEIWQWICAIAVWPRIRWEVVLAIGQKILENAQAIHKLNYTNLLKLARISWLKSGLFPPGIRLSLLKELNTDNEISARKTVLQLLSESDDSITEDSFTYREKQVQIYINSFVIFSNNEAGNTHIEQGALNFLGLWKSSSITDSALKIYLKNEKKTWETPIKLTGSEKNGVDDYIKRYFEKQQQFTKPQFISWLRITSNISTFIIFIALQLFIFNNTDIDNGKINKILPILKQDTTALSSVQFNIDTNICLRSWAHGDSVLDLTLETATRSYRKVVRIGKSFNQLDTVKGVIPSAIFDSIPNYQLLNISPIVHFTNASGSRLSLSLSDFSTRNTLSIRGADCIDPDKTVYIQYSSAIPEAQAEQFRQCIVANGYKAESIDNKQGPRRNVVRYFNQSMKVKAEQLASIASRCLSLAIETQYLALESKTDSLISDPKILEIWLNTGQDCQNVTFSSVPNLSIGNIYYNSDMSGWVRLSNDAVSYRLNISNNIHSSSDTVFDSFSKNANSRQASSLIKPSALPVENRGGTLKISKKIKYCRGVYTLYTIGKNGKAQDSILLSISANKINIIASKIIPIGGYGLFFNIGNYQKLSKLTDKRVLGYWTFKKDTIQFTNETIIVPQYREPVKILSLYHDQVNQSYIFYVETSEASLRYGIGALKFTNSGVYLSSDNGSAQKMISPPTNQIFPDLLDLTLINRISGNIHSPLQNNLAPTDTKQPPHRSSYKNGFAVYHQSSFLDSITMVAKQIKFVFIKATQGASFLDPKCAANVALAKKYRLPYSIYHYFTTTSSIISQANNFNAAYDKYGCTLPATVSLEEGFNNGRTAEETKGGKFSPQGASIKDYADSALRFISLLRPELRKNLIISTNALFARQYLDSRFSQYKLFMIDYSLNYDPNTGIPGIWPKANYWLYNKNDFVISNGEL